MRGLSQTFTSQLVLCSARSDLVCRVPGLRRFFWTRSSLVCWLRVVRRPLLLAVVLGRRTSLTVVEPLHPRQSAMFGSVFGLIRLRQSGRAAASSDVMCLRFGRGLRCHASLHPRQPGPVPAPPIRPPMIPIIVAAFDPVHPGVVRGPAARPRSLQASTPDPRHLRRRAPVAVIRVTPRAPASARLLGNVRFRQVLEHWRISWPSHRVRGLRAPIIGVVCRRRPLAASFEPCPERKWILHPGVGPPPNPDEE